MKRIVSVMSVVAIAAAAGYWAATVTLSAPRVDLGETPTPIFYTVTTATVEHSVRLSVRAEWSLEPAGTNLTPGMVTSINFEPGDVVGEGDVLYTVDLQPVVVALGSIPMFRDLRVGLSGPDVFQLESMLARSGLFSGDPNDLYDRTTRTAVEEWQRSLLQEPSGVVPANRLVFVPDLPARFSVPADIRVGSIVNLAQTLVHRVAESPDFIISVGSELAGQIDVGTRVDILYPAGRWSAKVERISPAEFDDVILVLGGDASRSVCGDTCVDWVAIEETSTFTAEVILVPATTGPAVPVAAIKSDSLNRRSVSLADGSARSIEIVAAANGIAIVAGLNPGEMILLTGN